VWLSKIDPSRQTTTFRRLFATFDDAERPMATTHDSSRQVMTKNWRVATEDDGQDQTPGITDLGVEHKGKDIARAGFRRYRLMFLAVKPDISFAAGISFGYLCHNQDRRSEF
jgi:hypothetical protein